jgi:putative membrane protein
MKKILLAGKVILGAGLLLVSLNSCKNENKQEDPKEVAEDSNEAKFDSIADKKDDSEFLVDIAEVNLAEIEIGKLAQTKSTNPEVKKFGKMIVDEHTKSASEVSALAKAKNFTLPTSLTQEGQDEYKKLNEKSGLDFDKKFADMMIDGHEKAIDKLKKATEDAKDQDVKLWASNNIAPLTAHLEHAKLLKQDLDKKK